MPAGELHEWMLYADLEPFGSHYDDLRAGSITAAIYNVNRNHERIPQPFGPLEFFPWNDVARQAAEPPPPMTPEQQSDALRALLGFQR